MNARPLHPTPFHLALAAFAFAAMGHAQAQTTTSCGDSVKAEVAKMLDGAASLGAAERASLEAQIYAKYKICAQKDSALIVASDPFFTAVRQCGGRTAYVGSLFYEEMPCCGYDPQRRAFACPVKIKQRTGFGASPLPGSRQYVMHCVADAAGAFQPVGVDSVHASDSTLSPPWQFAVVTHATQNLPLVQPMNGQARRVRSILSWNLQPTSCQYQPIWGNVIEYTVRLDP